MWFCWLGLGLLMRKFGMGVLMLLVFEGWWCGCSGGCLLKFVIRDWFSGLWFSIWLNRVCVVVSVLGWWFS